MVNELAENIFTSGSHLDCSQELEALVDIATFKDPNADSASARAEQQLLSLYAHPETLPATRENLIDQLLAREDILARGAGPDVEAFGMPASLLHLAAQHARRQMAKNEPDASMAPARLDAIRSTLKEATGLTDETDIVDSNREVTTDEMMASFATLPDACSQVVNLSSDVCDKPAQLQLLLDEVPDDGIAVAPMLVDGHFMLIAAEKAAAKNKYELTIANTLLPISDAVKRAVSSGFSLDKEMSTDVFIRVREECAERFTKELTEKIAPGFAGKIASLEICSNHLQAHAVNSCGPLVSLLADRVATREDRWESVGRQIQNLADEWRALNEEQQINAAIAHRAKMIGKTVVWRTESRFIDDRLLRRDSPMEMRTRL